MKYVEETGTVEEVDGETATVRLDNRIEESCGSCCACDAFQSGDNMIDIPARDVAQGDRVEVRIPRVNTFLSILLIFIIPLGLFMTGITVGQQLQGGARIGNISVIGGVIGLVAGMGFAWIMNRVISSRAEIEARKISSE